jgi:hypothetical protein
MLSVLGIWYTVVYYIKGPTVTNTFFFYELTNKNTVYGKLLVVVIRTPMFQLLNGHYH